MTGPEYSKRLFQFGNNGMLRSLGKYSVPAVIAGMKCNIEFDVINSDIPLLLSKKAMKAMKMRIDLDKDTACVWGVTIDLKTAESGHYLLPLLGDSEEVNIDCPCSSNSVSEKGGTGWYSRIGRWLGSGKV